MSRLQRLGWRFARVCVAVRSIFGRQGGGGQASRSMCREALWWRAARERAQVEIMYGGRMMVLKGFSPRDL